MAQQIQWASNVQVADGPAFVLAGSMTVDAYDHVALAVKKGQKSPAAVALPGAEGKVLLVLITSDYLDASLMYTLGDAGKPASLDQSQLFAGAGAVQHLGSPLSIAVDNTNGTKDANVQVLVGRTT